MAVLAAMATVGSLGVVGTGAAAAAPEPTPTLSGRSVLPAKTYVPDSEPSGHWTTGNAAIPAPYPGQPVQGFSATHKLGDDSYLVMSDNGFGTKANSADFLLSVHRIRPDLKSGTTDYINTLFTLADPERHITWPIWRDGGCAAASSLPKSYTCPKPDRRLTGADFDPESMQVGKDGTFWFGDEFGPYLLHTDAQGRLLESPIPTPGVKSPSNPTLAGEKPNLADSKGYEGMAISPDRRTLYPMLEGAVEQDTNAGRPEARRIYQVSAKQGRFTGRRWTYRMEDKGHAVGDFIAVNSTQFLVIERDNTQGAEASFKRIYAVDLKDTDPQGYLRKRLVVDLMKVADPKNLGRQGNTFTFPFFTIEDVELVDADTIAVMNDNNFPAAGGRSTTEPDQNEFITIDLPQPLPVDARLMGSFIPYGPQRGGRSYSVIGDVPYGAAQAAAFLGMIDDINRGGTDLTVHVGDIKSGSTRCDDAYYARWRSDVGRLSTPLIYTPGDNEWTDCHRTNNGSYNPLERLSHMRRTFFSTDPLGATQPQVESRAAQGFPENVEWQERGVSFAAVHIVGSNDGLLPWQGLGKTQATPEQVADQRARMNNALAVMNRTFDQAKRRGDRGVALFLQADMFDPGIDDPKPADNSAFREFVERLAALSNGYRGTVYLINGDSHVFNVDTPLGAGSKWLEFYGIQRPVPNLTRVTVDGSENNTNWLRLTISKDRRSPLGWQQVAYRMAGQ